MLQELVLPSSSDLTHYDPVKGLKVITTTDAAIRFWRRAKDSTQLFQAIKAKLLAQAEYVIWRDSVVVPSRKTGAPGRGRKKRISVLQSVLPKADPGAAQICRWRARLCVKTANGTKIDNTKLATELEATEARCVRICEGEKQVKQFGSPRKYPMSDKEILRRASAIHLERTKARRSEINKKIQTQAFPDGKHYSVVLADPAWPFTNNMSPSRRIDNHYPIMSLEEICALPVGNITTSSAVLFLWVPISLVPEGLEVCKAWGCTYKTNIAWTKDRPGMGFYVRGMHELLFIATKGAPLVPEPADRPESVLVSPRRAHSEKPHIYGIIEAMYPDFNRIELFARNPRRGWDAWGNEGVGKSRLKFQSV